jgi:hypothetical protein
MTDHDTLMLEEAARKLDATDEYANVLVAKQIRAFLATPDPRHAALLAAAREVVERQSGGWGGLSLVVEELRAAVAACEGEDNG